MYRLWPVSPTPLQLPRIRLCCLQPLNNPSPFSSSGSCFMKPHLRHLIQQLSVSIFISTLDCLFLKFRAWGLFVFISPAAPFIASSTWSFLNKYLFSGMERKPFKKQSLKHLWDLVILLQFCILQCSYMLFTNWICFTAGSIYSNSTSRTIFF